MMGGTDHEHGGGAGAHASNRVRFPGPDDLKCPPGFVGWTDDDDRDFAPRLLAQARAEDRVRWHGRASWHPVLTYSTIMLASGWLAGAWYAWVIDGNGAMLATCLAAAGSTIFPGIPWKELIATAKEPKHPDETPHAPTRHP